jgi:hypothetical protein
VDSRGIPLKPKQGLNGAPVIGYEEGLTSGPSLSQRDP